MSKVFIGVRLQRLREERGLTQSSLAKTLGISPSYLNQIERNQRPLTVPILLRINAEFGIDVQVFSDDDEAALISELRDVLTDTGNASASLAEIKALTSNMPDIAKTFVDLHRRYRAVCERADTLEGHVGTSDLPASLYVPAAHEEVRDYFNRQHNHIAELDAAAEDLFKQEDLQAGNAGPRLRDRLEKKHGIALRILRAEDYPYEDKSTFLGGNRELLLPDYLRPGQATFQLAAQLALLESGETIDALIKRAGFHDAERSGLARIGLANYFAGALLMPYTSFLQAAREMDYDIQRLANRFVVSFESVCHRLSTLQRPGNPGLPLFFVRVDRAGNVSKRHSATDFHFSRVGGTCPLWVVYEAFSQPGRILTQVTQMPDGRRHFWIARQVVSGSTGFGRPQKTFAVGLGCDLRHAHQLVYSRGLDLSDIKAATPIGPGCKVCERSECLQRAFPGLHSAPAHRRSRPSPVARGISAQTSRVPSSPRKRE